MDPTERSLIPDQFKLEVRSGWCSGLRRLPSPNFDARPRPCALDLIVVHAISLPPGEFGRGYIERFFLNRLEPVAHPYFATISGQRVSAHFLIDRLGAVTQFVSVHDRAWHAGASAFQGRDACNDFSIGIELEGCDDKAFSDAQYDSLVGLTAALLRDCRSLSRERIVGHSDIAPGRKTDPGPRFDWSRFRALLDARLPG